MQEQITALFGSNNILWLEGKRLTNAGFMPNDEYRQIWITSGDRRIICALGEFTTESGENFTLVRRKVNRQGNNSAIRIEGARVKEFFAGYKALKVTYEAGLITIRGHEKIDAAVQEAA